MIKWVDEVDEERRNRIRLSLWAYAYEVHDVSLVSDSEFDRVSLLVDKSVRTGNRKLDKFFRDHFEPSSGMWVHKHPEKDRLERLYKYLYGKD